MRNSLSVVYRDKIWCYRNLTSGLSKYYSEEVITGLRAGLGFYVLMDMIRRTTIAYGKYDNNVVNKDAVIRGLRDE